MLADILLITCAVLMPVLAFMAVGAFIAHCVDFVLDLVF